jgi:low molecular weight protein-tyrosine phosphatase
MSPARQPGFSPPELPPPREAHGPYRISCICLGNICRSPTAAVVLRSRATAAGLADRVEIDSGGTGDWHLGDRIDSRARSVLAASGYAASRHRARRIEADWFDTHDLFLAMDRANLMGTQALAPDPVTAEQRVMLFRAFDPLAEDSDAEVPDPYYRGMDDYRSVLTIVERTVDVLVDRLVARLAAQRDIGR